MTRMRITRSMPCFANYFSLPPENGARLFLPICIDIIPTIEFFTPTRFCRTEKIVMRINARIAPPILHDNGGEADETEFLL